MSPPDGAGDGDDDMDGLTPDLSHAGAIVDKAIEHMVGQNLESLAIASALLGGAMGLMLRTMDPDAIRRVLQRAAASLQTDLARPSEPH